MPATAAGRVAIASNVLLDGRLALFHEAEKWLAVADLHFGYELSQRAAGRLVPLWGMTSIEARLAELLDEYQPRQLIILGDLVHDAASATAASELLARLRQRCEVTAADWESRSPCRARRSSSCRAGKRRTFLFQHGHCAPEETDRIRIIGHHHPAATIRDGAGLRLKFPALIQQERCWILPAFSPWAGGVSWPDDGECRIWLCTSGASVASIDVSLREMPKECSASRLRRQLSGAMRATRCLDRNRHRAGGAILRGRRRIRGGLLHAVERFHNEENAERDDEEVNDDGDKVAPRQDGAQLPRVGQRQARP